MRVGLVGCGRWGRYILRDLRTLGMEVPVVARSEESRARASEGEAAEIVGTIDALHDVQGIVVATPTPDHAETVREALEHGVPVYVEKPLTSDAAAAAALAAAAGDRLFVMDKWRYHRGVEAMAAMARSGTYGPVRALASRRLSWGQNHDEIDAVWILVPHDLSIIREITGSYPEPLAAVGTISGSDASLTAVLGPEPACTVETSSLSPSRERKVVVEFERAVVALDDAYAENLRVVDRESGEETAVPIADDLPLYRELEDFVGHLRGGPPPRSSAADGATAVALIARLREMAGLP